jgi:hypothetical protein
MNRLLTVFAFALCSAVTAQGQASSNCQVRPKSLAAMRHCYRPLLVFSPTGNDPRLKEQTKLLDEAADDMMDRFVMLTPVLPDARRYATPLDTPYAVLSAKEMAAIREHFHIPVASFTALLLDEDGSEVLRSDKPIGVTRLNARIDVMPRRKIEEQRKDAY